MYFSDNYLETFENFSQKTGKSEKRLNLETWS